MGLENDQALESILVNIRSVVQSCKGGVLLSDLQDDYRKLIGTCIPFEKFGYDCLETLLNNAPGFLSIKKNTNGQLFAEAVADSSTAHLSSLISKQKRGKSKKEPKPSVLKTKSYGSYRSRKNYATSVWSNSSAADEKDKEIGELKSKLEREKSMNEELSFEVSRLQAELKVASNRAFINTVTVPKHQQNNEKVIQDLKSKLEKEMRINNGYSSEMERVNSQLKKSEDALRVERESVQKLNEKLNSLSLQVPTDDEINKKNEKINILLKEIEELNSKLEKEKKISRDFSSQMIRLNSLVKTSQNLLSAEQDTVKKLKSQMEALQSSAVKETSPVYEYLSSDTTSKEKCKSLQNLSSNGSWDGHLNLLETDAAKQLNSCNNASSTSDQNPMVAVMKAFEEQMSDRKEKFVSQIKKQNQKLMMLEKTEQRNYQKLDEKIRNVEDSLNIENIIQTILQHPQFLQIFESKSYYASDNVYQSIPSITPISSQSDNDSERSFKAGMPSTIARGKYGPPRAEAYKTKRTEERNNSCQISKNLVKLS